jgi:hypothetical protein
MVVESQDGKTTDENSRRMFDESWSRGAEEQMESYLNNLCEITE